MSIIDTYVHSDNTEYEIADSATRTRVSAVEGKIPSGASSSNKMATASDITTVTNGVKANTKLMKDTVGWSGKNKGFWVNKSLSGDSTNGYLLGDNGSSIIAKIENNTNYKAVKKDGQGNRFRVILFVDMPSYTPSLTADQVIHDNTAHEVSFSSGNYNYAVLTYDNASVISQDIAEAMIYDADILDDTYEPYFGSTAVNWSSYVRTGVHQLFPNKTNTVSSNVFTVDSEGYVSTEYNPDYRPWAYGNSNVQFKLKKGTYKLKGYEKTASTSGPLGLKIISSSGIDVVDASQDANFEKMLSTGYIFTLSVDTDLGVEYKLGNGSYAFVISVPEDNYDGVTDYAMTNRELTELKTGTVTATIPESATLESSKYATIGRSCWVYLKIKLTAELASGSRINLNSTNLPTNALGESIFSPVFEKTGVTAFIRSNSAITFSNHSGSAIASGTELQTSFCYPI